jgi:hypothetical protein
MHHHKIILIGCALGIHFSGQNSYAVGAPPSMKISQLICKCASPKLGAPQKRELGPDGEGGGGGERQGIADVVQLPELPVIHS